MRPFLIPLCLAACAPTLQPLGPIVQPPALSMTDFATVDGVRLPLRSWLPPATEPVRAAVLSLHGFNDYSNGMTALGASLAARGIAVYAYDQRGFGAAPGRGIWPGTETLAADAASAFAALQRAYPTLPVFLEGESMGGAVVVASLTAPLPAGIATPHPAGGDSGIAGGVGRRRHALLPARRLVAGLSSGSGLDFDRRRFQHLALRQYPDAARLRRRSAVDQGDADRCLAGACGVDEPCQRQCRPSAAAIACIIRRA